MKVVELMRTLVSKLLILLMSLHILVPAGFMLGQSGGGSGGPTIVICKGDVFGALRIASNSDSDPDQKNAPHSLCPYVSFGAVTAGAATPQPVAVPVTYHTVEFAESALIRIPLVRWQRPSVRAPPIAA